MGVHRLGEIARGRAHLDGEHAFADQIAGTDANDPNPQDALRVRLDDQLGEAVRTVEGKGAPGRPPGDGRSQQTRR